MVSLFQESLVVRESKWVGSFGLNLMSPVGRNYQALQRGNLFFSKCKYIRASWPKPPNQRSNLLIVTNVISKINCPLKNITHQATWGLTCAIIRNTIAQYRESKTIGLRRDILMFSFIPRMSCDYVVLLDKDREILWTLPLGCSTDSNLSPSGPCVLPHEPSSCPPPTLDPFILPLRYLCYLLPWKAPLPPGSI